MSLRTIIIVLLALVSGASAAVGVNRLRHQDLATKPDMVSIVVAATPLPRGTKISADSLTMHDYPKDLVPACALTRVDDAVERYVFIPLVKDEPVVDPKLAAKGMGPGIASLIRKGMRAFTILTPSLASGVAGFILPGDRVDVLLTVSNTGSNDPTGGGSTTTLLQNVEILAVDQRMEAPADNKMDAKELRSVTLLVTPDQATKLDLGQNKGTLHLSLRHPEDNQAAITRPATMAELQWYQEKPWDERAKGLLATFGEIMAKMPKPTAASKALAVPNQELPAVAQILTLRGTQEGQVLLHELSRQP